MVGFPKHNSENKQAERDGGIREAIVHGIVGYFQQGIQRGFTRLFRNLARAIEFVDFSMTYERPPVRINHVPDQEYKNPSGQREARRFPHDNRAPKAHHNEEYGVDHELPGAKRRPKEKGIWLWVISEPNYGFTLTHNSSVVPG
jgi:hypothetical protein